MYPSSKQTLRELPFLKIQYINNPIEMQNQSSRLTDSICDKKGNIYINVMRYR